MPFHMYIKIYSYSFILNLGENWECFDILYWFEFVQFTFIFWIWSHKFDYMNFFKITPLSSLIQESFSELTQEYSYKLCLSISLFLFEIIFQLLINSYSKREQHACRYLFSLDCFYNHIHYVALFNWMNALFDHLFVYWLMNEVFLNG